jgi:hypothetical protein
MNVFYFFYLLYFFKKMVQAYDPNGNLIGDGFFITNTPSTSGQELISTSTTTAQWTTVSNPTVTIFNTPGTFSYTSPAKCKYIDVLVVAGGGGGGGGGLTPPAANLTGGAGGGGGSFFKKTYAPAVSKTVVVGAAGAGMTGLTVTPTGTNAGGTSSYDADSAGGGSGGYGGTGGSIRGSGGLGGLVISATGSYFSSSGQYGEQNFTTSNVGAGGHSYFMNQNRSNVQATSIFIQGLNGNAFDYGCGGGGGKNDTITTANGGNGVGGVVIIREFYQ